MPFADKGEVRKVFPVRASYGWDVAISVEDSAASGAVESVEIAVCVPIGVGVASADSTAFTMLVTELLLITSICPMSVLA